MEAEVVIADFPAVDCSLMFLAALLLLHKPPIIPSSSSGSLHTGLLLQSTLYEEQRVFALGLKSCNTRRPSLRQKTLGQIKQQQEGQPDDPSSLPGELLMEGRFKTPQWG